MKASRLSILASLLLAIVTMTGCTQNNGHIGKLFGSWALVEMTCDNELMAIPTGSMSFQSSMVCFTLRHDADYRTINVGTWQQIDDFLIFDFSHHSDGSASGEGVYAPPSWMHFEGNNVKTDVVELSGKRLELLWVDHDGHIYNYKFDRTW